MFTSNKMAVLGGDSFRDEYSLAFDGSNDYINFGNVLNLGTGDFSISIWVKTSDFHGQYFIVKKQDVNNRWYLRGSGDAPRFQFYSVVSGSAALQYYGDSAINLDDLQNQWVHFVLSADRDGNIVGYINGILDDTDSADTTDLDNTGNLQLCKYDSTYADCSISEIAFYDKALSANEARTIYNSREPFNHKVSAFSGNLTTWWRMGDGKIDRLQSDPVVSDETDTSLGDELWDADKQRSGDVTGWTAYGNNTIEDNGSEIKITYVDDTSGVLLLLKDASQLSSDLTVDQTYQIKFDIKVNTGSVSYIEYDGSTAALVLDTIANTSYVTKTYFMKAKHTTGAYIRIGNMNSGEIAYLTNFSCKPIGGKPGHAVNMTISDFERGAK